MQIRYQSAIKSLSFEKLCDPNEAVRYFLMYIHNLMRQYMAACDSPDRFFTKAPMSGMDAMLCRKIISKFKQRNKDKDSIKNLIACLKESNELLEESGVVAALLSVMFSYFPEYLPNEVASKLKLDFTWAEDFYTQKKYDREVDDIWNFEYKEEEKKPTYDLKKQPKYTIDAAFKLLNLEDMEGFESDDDHDLYQSFVHAIGSHSVNESKNIVDRLLAKVPVKQDQYEESKEFDQDMTGIVFNIMSITFNDKVVPKEIASPIAGQVAGQICEYLRNFQYDNVRDCLGIFLDLSEHLNSQDLKKIVHLCDEMPEEVFSQEPVPIITMIKLFEKNINKADSDTLNRMVKVMLKNPKILAESDQLLPKIAYFESDNEYEAREHWVRQRMIVNGLVDKMKLNMQVDSRYFGAGCYALRLIIPALSLHERISITRETMLLDRYKTSETTNILINVLRNVHEREKIVREMTGFNKDITRAIVKAGN